MSHGAAIRTASRHLHALRRPPLRLTPPSTDISHPVSYLHLPAPQAQGEDVRTFHPNPRMIFVRPWDGIPTISHAFAIVRDIERRFGKIQEFVVLRDPDVLSSCAPFLHATFTREEDAAAIPLDGKVIQVVAPNVDEKREGGIGLDDLHVYLNPETREAALLDRKSVPDTEPEWRPPEEGQLMDVKLERTGSRAPPLVLDRPLGFGRKAPPHLYNHMRTQELAQAITSFGGFVDRPIITQRNETSMQALVARWSRMVKRPTGVQPDSALDPVEKPVDEDSATSAEELLEWKAFESESTTPAPSAVSIPTPTLTPMPASPPVTPLPVTPPPVVSSPVAPPPVASPPVAPSTFSARSKPTSEATLKPQRIQPEVQPVPKVTPVQPKLSKKQRMLNAARLAGAMKTEKSPDVVEGPADASGAVADQSSPEVAHDPKPTNEENKFAARKWWSFLTGGKG
ncbi:hypothetical protein JB92DRAFT_3131939 [Gautieria morchelliformis]|nr:hypothetical protein JB92DRAFT_3131939 [Gautieria morchelliformis]